MVVGADDEEFAGSLRDQLPDEPVEHTAPHTHPAQAPGGLPEMDIEIPHRIKLRATLESYDGGEGSADLSRSAR